jgi:hypothetical protein
MKTQHIIIALAAVAVILPATPASALSCLPTDMYIDEVIGKDEVVIFTATVNDQVKKDDYTAEMVTVTAAHQGYVENTIFVYHQKDETWGYLCNSGPKEVGATGVYIAERDAKGTYNVSQRLDTTDNAELIATLTEKLADADITGEIVTLTTTDRMAQIMTTVSDLFQQIKKLFSEYTYWKNS